MGLAAQTGRPTPNSACSTRSLASICSVSCRRFRIRPVITCCCQAADQQQQQQQSVVFDSLASLLCPTEIKGELKSTALGRGLVVTEDVPAGTTLLTVDAFSTLSIVDEPLRTGKAFGAAVLDDWQATWGSLPPLLASYLQSSRGDWFRRLVSWLLWLKRHCKHPVWQMYLQLLPQEGDMSSLMNFTPEERQELQLPHLIALAEKERDGIQGLHDSLFSSTTGELRALDLAPDFTDTLWAACMVNSRCFSDCAGRELLSMMVPLADMVNHSSQPNAAYKLDPASQTFSVFSTQVWETADSPEACQQMLQASKPQPVIFKPMRARAFLERRAHMALASGEEVLISYASKDNTNLMKDYGFVLPGNVLDAITFSSGDQQPLLSPVGLMQAAAAAAESAGGVQGADADARKRRIQAVLKSLQLYVTKPSTEQETMQPSQAQCQDQQSLQQQLVEVLLQQCRQQINKLPTSVEEDRQLLVSLQGQGSSRLQAAISARLEHKLLLGAAIEVLSSYRLQQKG